MGRWIQLTLFRSEAPISLDDCQHLLEKDAELQIHIKRFSFAFFRDKAMIGNKTLQKWEATTKRGCISGNLIQKNEKVILSALYEVLSFYFLRLQVFFFRPLSYFYNFRFFP